MTEENKNNEIPEHKVEKKEGQMWLSYSRMSAYKECPWFFKQAYIDKVQLDIKGNYHTALGNGVHKCLEEMYKQNKYDLKFLENWWNIVCHLGYTEKNGQQVLAILDDPEYEFRDSDEKNMLFYHGKKLIKEYYHKNKHEFGGNRTIATELNFQVPVGQGKVVLNGYIDRIDRAPDGGIIVVDYKTGKERNQDDVDQDLQLTLYAFAIRKTFDENEKELYLHFIKSGNKVKTIRTKEHFDALLNTVKYVKSGIENGHFEPTEGKQCRYCYYDCPLGINKKNLEEYTKNRMKNTENDSSES